MNDLQIIQKSLAKGVDIFHDDYPHFHPLDLYIERGFGMDSRGAVYCAPEKVEGDNLVVRLFGRGEYEHLTNKIVTVPKEKVRWFTGPEEKERWFTGSGQPEWTYHDFDTPHLIISGMSAADFAATYPNMPF